MRIVQTIASVCDEASGPSYSVPRLCSSIAARGHEVTLMSLQEANPREERCSLKRLYQEVQLERPWCWPRYLSKLGQSPAMAQALRSSDADIFHTHGLWMMPNVYPASASRKKNRPFVLSPRGMLGNEALRYSRHKKLLMWFVAQGRAVKVASCLHATAASEYLEIRSCGLKQPVAIIPNGIELPTMSANWPLRTQPTVLSLGRIHPKKGLDRLIRAWALIEADYPNWRLDLVGPDEGGHSWELQRLIQKLALSRVTISGPIFGEAKWRRLAQAELFTLPTLNENFAMTVAESLACGTPVISTKGAPWAGLEQNRCGWWIDHGPEPMAVALRAAMSLSSEERCAMGTRGQAWMARDFSWDGIAAQMTDVYRWLIDGGERPHCVIED